MWCGLYNCAAYVLRNRSIPLGPIDHIGAMWVKEWEYDRGDDLQIASLRLAHADVWV